MIVISYCTPEAYYRVHAKRLRRECDSLNLQHKIIELPETGSWLKNCCHKPKYILDCLLELKQPVLWIDGDGSILRYPHYFEDGAEYDFQAKQMSSHRKRQWHVGTMWWNYTPDAIRFIERWVENTGEMTDESALEVTWREGLPLKARDIPASYFSFDETDQNAVIVHRCSRTPKKINEADLADRYEREVI
jgi:hypothetical protein